MLRTIFTIVALSFALSSQEPSEIPGPAECPIVVTSTGELRHECGPVLNPTPSPTLPGPGGCPDPNNPSYCLPEGSN